MTLSLEEKTGHS